MKHILLFILLASVLSCTHDQKHAQEYKDHPGTEIMGINIPEYCFEHGDLPNTPNNEKQLERNCVTTALQINQACLKPVKDLSNEERNECMEMASAIGTRQFNRY